MEVFNAANSLLNASIFSFFATDTTDWITLILLAALVILTLLFTLHRRKYTLLLRSLYSSRYFTQLSHEGKIFEERIYLFDLAFILLTQSVFFYFIIEIYFPSIFAVKPPFFTFLIIMGILVLDFVFKCFMTFSFTYLYDIKSDRTTFFSYKLFTQSSNSLILFPLVVTFTYTSFLPVLLLYIPVFSANFLIMAYRLFLLNRKKIRPFHFFVYFCTFEILPYLILVKILLILDNQAL
ncbi:DUF4271 domain-containing protein [Bacteroidales bacterium OttesenSCG-928-B11]|nr:DUF4271 domain-containing protein [Bacteroidales bacterium OttesenSCG-928-B11]